THRGARSLSRRERLECWAEALERVGGRRLKTLFETEHAPRNRRATLRADDSPLSVAFNDPRLRAEALAGDTMGDAVTFFGISEWELHNILCFCHHGTTVTANEVAVRVRTIAAHRPLSGKAMFVGTFVATSLTICALMI